MAVPSPRERLTLAFLVSVTAHAAVLANASFAPGLKDFALFATRQPLSARLAVAAAPEQTQPQAEVPRREPSPSAAGLPAPEIFYRGSEVDQRAAATNHPDIEYPERALAASISGTVRLQLKIDYQGVLREAVVLSARPAGVFDDAALKAARALKFKPAFRNGVPVGSVKLIEVPFDPDCLRTGSCIPESASTRR